MSSATIKGTPAVGLCDTQNVYFQTFIFLVESSKHILWCLKLSFIGWKLVDPEKALKHFPSLTDKLHFSNKLPTDRGPIKVPHDRLRCFKHLYVGCTKHTPVVLGLFHYWGINLHILVLQNMNVI